MNNVNNPAEMSWMIHWIYTKEEWHHFERATARQRGFWKLIWHLLFSRSKPIQSVEFTDKFIEIEHKRTYLNGFGTKLKRVDISDEGDRNIINITCEQKNLLVEMRLPVPKGKLKQAIEIQERLMDKLKSI